MKLRGVAAATIVIMLGTLVSSVLGFLRAFVIARYFGAHTATDAFFAALIVPQIVYIQLIGGAVSAVLIPSFSRMAAEDEGELWLVVRTVFLLEAALALGAVCILELLAHPLMIVVASGFELRVHTGGLPLSVDLVRVLLLTLPFSTMSAVTTATLYSLGRRAAASLAPGLFHLGIIAGAVLGAARFGIGALAAGAVAGSVLQLAVQVLPLLRSRRGRSPARQPETDWPETPGGYPAGQPGRPFVDVRHPAVLRLARLYLPLMCGLMITGAGQIVELNFRSHLPVAGGLSSMQYAIQLVQFPVGIVATGLALAVLPAISLAASPARPPSRSGTRRVSPASRSGTLRVSPAGRYQAAEGFADMLSLAMRASIILMAPAMVGLLVLATPTVALLYQRGQFTPLDTAYAVRALLGYAPQLPLLGVAQLLIYAFYARQNTLIPALAGAIGVAVYVVAASLLAPLTMLGLALAHTISVAAQTAVLFTLLLRSLDRRRLRRLLETILKVGLAGAAMALTAGMVGRLFVPPGTGVAARLLALTVPGIAALAVYALVLLLLQLDGAHLAASIWARRPLSGARS